MTLRTDPLFHNISTFPAVWLFLYIYIFFLLCLKNKETLCANWRTAKTLWSRKTKRNNSNNAKKQKRKGHAVQHTPCSDYWPGLWSLSSVTVGSATASREIPWGKLDRLPVFSGCYSATNHRGDARKGRVGQKLDLGACWFFGCHHLIILCQLGRPFHIAFTPIMGHSLCLFFVLFFLLSQTAQALLHASKEQNPRGKKKKKKGQDLQMT